MARTLGILGAFAAALALSALACGDREPAVGDRPAPVAGRSLSTALERQGLVADLRSVRDPADAPPLTIVLRRPRLDAATVDPLVHALFPALPRSPEPRLDARSLTRLATTLDGLGRTRLSVERSCPPPALLGCRVGIRLVATVGVVPPAEAADRFERSARAVLEADGFERLRRSPAGPRRGRLLADEESLAAWDVSDRRLLGALGGLRPRGGRVASRSARCPASRRRPACAAVAVIAAPLAALLRDTTSTGAIHDQLESDLAGTIRLRAAG